MLIQWRKIQNANYEKCENFSYYKQIMHYYCDWMAVKRLLDGIVYNKLRIMELLATYCCRDDTIVWH